MSASLYKRWLVRKAASILSVSVYLPLPGNNSHSLLNFPTPSPHFIRQGWGYKPYPWLFHQWSPMITPTAPTPSRHFFRSSSNQPQILPFGICSWLFARNILHKLSNYPITAWYYTIRQHIILFGKAYTKCTHVP